MNNPYAAPAALMDDRLEGREATYMPKALSLEGRIGRVRYLAYCIGLTGPVYAVMAVVEAVGRNAMLATFLSLILSLLALAIVIVLMKRRLNDLDKSGWLAVLLFVPVLNIFMGLYLLFARGSEGSNRYGLAPAPNSSGVIALAWVLPLVFVIGIAAAVAIPVYQDYVQRAKASAVMPGNR